MSSCDNSTVSAHPSARLIDNHGRIINYLRLAITDRCNLRCRYCRPEQDVPYIPHEEILSFEELERLASIFCSLGIDKIRVTGGEPFARKGCLPFLQRLKNTDGLETLYITTNGVETGQYLAALAELGINGINLSLDTLDQKRFWQISRRDSFHKVYRALQEILELGIPLKVNSVILEDTTDKEIIRLAELAGNILSPCVLLKGCPFPVSQGRNKLLTAIL